MATRGSRKPSGGGQEKGDRLDNLLVERGLAETRSRAQAVILAGSVRVGGEVVTKAGGRYPHDSELDVEERSLYVSRAGEKLAGALDEFGARVEGRDCLDAGASTGGFTDVLLQREASRVISADVGYGQFDWRLRNDPRVTVLERTNIRHLSAGDLPFGPDLLVADLSFISLPVALGKVVGSSESLGEMILLVKPQFEAGPEHVGRGGVVRDPEAREEAVRRVIRNFEALSFGAVGLSKAAVTGRRSGNQEYPLRLLHGRASTLTEPEITEMVRA